MNRQLPPLLLLPLLFMASNAMADAYKCRLPDGRTLIQAEACADGGQAVKVVAGDTVSDEERERAALEAQRLREQAEQHLNARREKEKQQEKQEKQEQQARERNEMRQAPSPPAAVEPVYVPAPYYVGPGQLQPPRPRPPPHAPGKPGGKPITPKPPISHRGR